jgi:hypothetical protein
MPPWIEYFAVAVCAISGVLAAEGKHMDLFGVMVLALVTAVGGGTIRDLCIGAEPVFWIQQPYHVWTALGAAAVTFVLARFFHPPERLLSVADAFGLALFGIAGTEKALAYGTPAMRSTKQECQRHRSTFTTSPSSHALPSRMRRRNAMKNSSTASWGTSTSSAPTRWMLSRVLTRCLSLM